MKQIVYRRTETNDNGRRELDPDEKYLQDVEALLANCEQCDGAGCEACEGYGLKLRDDDVRRKVKARVKKYERAVKKQHPDFKPAEIPKKTKKTKKTKKRTGTKGRLLVRKVFSNDVVHRFQQVRVARRAAM